MRLSVVKQVVITDRALNVLVIDSSSSNGRWICQQVSLSAVVIFTKNAYLEELIETCILYFFQCWIL
jgi:hypothetical protein